MIEDNIQPEQPSKARSVKMPVLIVGVLAVGAVMSLVGPKAPQQCGCIPPHTGADDNPSMIAQHGSRPRLLDLGATTCVPCKKMVPVLEELKAECEGRLDVQFVDVWKVPGVADQYGVTSIPTQIFFDASGKELFRHQGFFAKDDILSRWAELGVDLTK